MVVFRLGRSSGARGPGLVVINPITDRVTLVDLREQFLEIPHQVAITKDNASIAIDFIIFTKVFDPVMSVLAVKDFRGAGAQCRRHHPAGGRRRHEPRRGAVQAGGHEQHPALQAGRRHRAVGREGDQRRGPRDQPAARPFWTP